ncbi:MAG: DNA breaking-rejoining protein [Geminicoccaceae bacterium]
MQVASIAVSLCVLIFSARADDQIREQRVQFEAGTSAAVIEDSITGYESVAYVLRADADQTMTVALETDHGATYFNLYGPGEGPGDLALANSQFTEEINSLRAVLPDDGDYTVSVYMMRAAARREETAAYRLRVAIED